MAAQQRGDAVDERRLGLIVDEEVQQFVRKPARGGRLLEDDVDDVATVEVAGSAQERLAAVVVLARVVVERTEPYRPAGERARALANVLSPYNCRSPA